MIIRQVNKFQYQSLCQSLLKTGYTEPLEAWYTVPVKIIEREFYIKILPAEENRVAVLQVNEIVRDEDGLNFITFADDETLGGFLKILLWQGF